MMQVEIDKSLKDLNVPIINWDNEITTLDPGNDYIPTSTVIRICAIEDSIITNEDESKQIIFPKGSIEYINIKYLHLESGSINIVNI